MMVSRRRRTPQIRHAAVPPNAIVPRPTSGHLMATPPDGSPTEPSMTERSRTIAWREPSALSAATRELSGLEPFARIIPGELPGPRIGAPIYFRLVAAEEAKAGFGGG